MRRPTRSILDRAAATAANEQPSYRRRVSDEHRYASFAGTAGNVPARSASRAWPVQKTPLYSRDDCADGQHRRRLVDDYYSHRLLHGGCADAANVPNPRVLRRGGSTRLPGIDLAGARTGPGAVCFDGYRPGGFGDLGRVR